MIVYRQILIAGLVLLSLAACGVDGPPTAPEATPTGITISGDARVGVVVP